VWFYCKVPLLQSPIRGKSAYACRSSIAPLDFSMEPSIECPDNDSDDVAFIYAAFMCHGLVHRVSWFTGYDPKFWIRPVPSSSKRLRNYTPHTRYGPSTPSGRGGATNLKRTEPLALQTISHPHYGRCGQVGFHHLSVWPTSLPDPRRARASRSF
jgi:hypothetical protein